MEVKESDIYSKEMLIFGCGNTLFGNDGFGPEVIKHINNNFAVPGNILVMDVGTGIRDFIFDLILTENKPYQIIIIDAVTSEGKNEGDIFEMALSQVPKEKMSDFSLHQSPSSNLLSQLKETGVSVRVLGMHTPAIPNEINPGLSKNAQKAVKKTAEWVINEIKIHQQSKRNYTDVKRGVHHE